MSERADNIFHALDWQREPWADTSRIMLLTGTAGGGKSKIAGEKLNAYLKRYPKSTGVVVRKTRASMVNSTLLFLERDVMGGDSTIKHVTSKRRFEYSNGSVLAYGGMADEDQREQLRSIGQDGSVDIAWMEEANRFDENDFNELIARLRGRSAPWRQVILSTNADSPAHWIYKRLITGGEASVYFSKAENNTYNPDDYTETLNSLTGILKNGLPRVYGYRRKVWFTRRLTRRITLLTRFLSRMTGTVFCQLTSGTGRVLLYVSGGHYRPMTTFFIS